MTQEVVRALAGRAEELFLSREMHCAEAIMAALNEGLGGGLDPARARGLAVGFGEGLGKAGCVCGALSGAVLAASWFLSGALPPAKVRGVSRALHDAFKKEHGSPCCRVLTRQVRAAPAMHFAHCAGLTRFGAELAARAVLDNLPELAAHPRRARPTRGRRSRLASILRRVADRLG